MTDKIFKNAYFKLFFGMILAIAVFAGSLSISGSAYAAEKKPKKTVILAVDKMDFRDANYLLNDKCALGIMSAKTARGTGSSLESQFMTISSGIRVSVKPEDFTGIEKNGESMILTNFNLVNENLDKNYEDFSKKFKYSGELFHEKGMKTAFVGNDSAMMLVADKEGKVDYGEYIENYDDFYSVEAKVFDMLNKADLIAVSYDFESSINRKEFIKNLIYNMDADVFVISKYVGGNVAKGRNTTLKPIIYKHGEEGIINSRTTKREALSANIDIMPTILDKYGIEYNGLVGKKFEIEKVSKKDSEKTLTEIVQDKFMKYINLSGVKYSFNLLVITIIVAFILLYLIKKRSFKKFDILVYLPITCIAVSLLLGKSLAGFDSNLYFYIILIASIILNAGLKMINKLDIKWMGIAIFIIIFLEALFMPEMIYNSFVGYNNLIAGGRFFGFNNDIMGTFIGAFLVSYFYLRKDKPRYKQQVVTIVMVPILLITLSGKFGSNFGGLVTAAVLSLFLVYRDLLDRVSAKKKIGISIGVLAAMLIGVILMTRGTDSHIAGFFERVRLYGSEEFIYMVSRKFIQVINNAKKMPWILALLTQLTFLFNVIMDNKVRANMRETAKVFAFVSIVALLTNDTGVVALTYINTFVITWILTIKEKYLQ